MDLIDFLMNVVQDPVMYSLVFFVYVILAAVILPIPVEIGLFNSYINPIWLIFLLAIGKGIGSLIAFEIGTRVRGGLKKRRYRNSLMKSIIGWCENFVKRYGYYGLFVIMSIPLMIDSATLYLFSLLNPRHEKGGMSRNWFVLINVFAGATRGAIILVIAYLFSVKLV